MSEPPTAQGGSDRGLNLLLGLLVAIAALAGFVWFPASWRARSSAMAGHRAASVRRAACSSRCPVISATPRRRGRAAPALTGARNLVAALLQKSVSPSDRPEGA